MKNIKKMSLVGIIIGLLSLIAVPVIAAGEEGAAGPGAESVAVQDGSEPDVSSKEPEYELKGSRLYCAESNSFFTGTGFAKMTDGSYYYVINGSWGSSVNDIVKVTNLESHNGEWWLVQKGRFSPISTVAKNSKGWWRIENGKVDFNCNSVEKNSKGWWKIRNGKVDFSYNGFAENKNGWWYIRNGKVNFGKSDVMKATVDGRSGWWYVRGGQVVFTDTVAKNKNGWWRIENGKVNFGFKGFAQNQNGWWYLTGGKVKFNTYDVIKGALNGESAWWYVRKGQVIRTYNGLGYNKNGVWLIENGKVNFGFSGKRTFAGVTYSFTGGRTCDVNGWIDKGDGFRYYYKKGELQKNTIVGNYYVDNSGRRITDSVVMKAVAFVNAHSSASQTPQQRFKSCYQYLYGDGYHYERIMGVPERKDVAGRANYYFTNKKGNCYCFAAATAYVSKVLGFESRVTFGQIASVHGGMTNHSWAALKSNGTWYISDYYAYMATDSSYPRRHTAAHGVYILNVSGGKVSWESAR